MFTFLFLWKVINPWFLQMCWLCLDTSRSDVKERHNMAKRNEKRNASSSSLESACLFVSAYCSCPQKRAETCNRWVNQTNFLKITSTFFFSVQNKTPKKHCIRFDWTGQSHYLWPACVYASVHDVGSLPYLHAFICMLVYGSMDKCKWLRECIWDELTSLPEESKQWHDYCEVPSILMNGSTQLQGAVAPGTP